MFKPLICGLCLLLALPSFAHADEGRPVGHVDTVFKLLTPDDKIRIAAFEDPIISGITCFISRATTGGLKGAVGLAEDTSDASISCHQTGPIKFKEAIKVREKGEEVFNERRSFLFKQLHVTRFYDQPSNTFVYMTWSDRVIEGSPKNSITAVPLLPWNGEAPEAVKTK